MNTGRRSFLRRISFVVILHLFLISSSFAQSKTQNVILITLDGARTQEIFGGLDAEVFKSTNKNFDRTAAYKRFNAASPTERREKLMPFFWQTLMKSHGSIAGNRDLKSEVKTTNKLWFSYPGYSEILTGEPQAEIQSNDFVRYPHETALDYAQRRLGLKATEVAQVGSWDGFKYAASQKDGSFFMSGAYDAVPAELSTPEMDELVALRPEVLQLWEESSNDTLTFRLALSYLKRHQPRVLWLGFGQSDDWAHARRYDRLLDYLQLADRHLGELWATLQSMDRYRGNTTLIITTDHGRGRTPADWAEHDAGIEGSQDIWIAVIGPDTPAQGEVRGQAGVTQGDVAATMLQYLGLDHRDFNPDGGPPIPGSLKPRN